MNKVMYQICVLLLTIILGMSLMLSCTLSSNDSQWMSRNGKLKVLSTIEMINDLVVQIGGEYVDSAVLIQGELDPHSYQLVKGDDEKLAFADIIFFNGLGLEHGPSLQSYLLNYGKAFGLGDRLIRENPTLLLYFKGQ